MNDRIRNDPFEASKEGGSYGMKYILSTISELFLIGGGR
jgi:hypothetical protein